LVPDRCGGWRQCGAVVCPQSGDRTRRMLGRKLADGREALEEQGSDLLEKSRELFEKGRKVADDAAELFEKGRSMVKG